MLDIKNKKILELQESKYRDWFIQKSFYYDTHGANSKELTEQEWKERTKELIFSSINDDGYCAMIFHDQDLLEDGSIKPLHAHALLHFKNPRIQSGVMKSLGITRKENCQRAKAKSSSARYLCHLSNEALNSDKHIYPIENVSVKNCIYRDLIKQSTTKKALLKDTDEFVGRLSSEIQQGILIPDNARAQIIDTFGTTDGQKIWRQFRDVFKKDYQEYLNTKANMYIKNGRNLSTFYITGSGGTGKSRIAKSLALIYADDEPIHVAAAHGKRKTFDLVSTYSGQKISLLNEVTASSFAFREFCAVFDPYEFSPVNSRNTDKPWLAEKCFMTTSDPFDFFVKKIASTSDDKDETKELDNIYQLTRRFRYIISASKISTNSSIFEIRKFDNITRKFNTLSTVSCADITKNNDVNLTAKAIVEIIQKSENHHSNTLASVSDGPKSME